MATSYLTLEQIFLIHDEQIELFGGSHGIRDLALLESAAMRPQATFGGNDLYNLLFEKAAVLIHSVILNHPFIDGNKRTGIASAIVFLEKNKYALKANDRELVDIALQIANKQIDIDKISSWLKKHSNPLRSEARKM